ncbi:prephenate dehydratase [Candidatus Gracilibacteria bacterium]|nr:prephenate dehydratase [Candidatus Gracilibacteria bacterium]
MNIYYQGESGAYSNITAIEVAKLLGLDNPEIRGCETFEQVWEKIGEGHIGVLPIENSYAGPIHANLFAFGRYKASIIGTYNLPIHHCLLSLESDIKSIKTAISHPQALDQCYHFLQENTITAKKFYDTAGAAKHISETGERGIASISSKLAAEIYGLNIIEEAIEDQEGNTTRFLVVCLTSEIEKYNYTLKKGKVSLIFEARNTPASLYKCLGAFATNNVNLSKIENLPSFEKPFTSVFWVDFEGSLEDKSVKKALEELEFFTSDIRILGEY